MSIINIITMLEDYIIEGNYYGRKDYWDVSIVRIQQWMDYIEDIAYSTDVKCVGEYR